MVKEYEVENGVTVGQRATGFTDRNGQEFQTGDICKHRKIVCGGDEIYVVVRRRYNGKDEFGIHRQGFWEKECAGCWDYEALERNCLDVIRSHWDEAPPEVKATYEGFEDYA